MATEQEIRDLVAQVVDGLLVPAPSPARHAEPAPVDADTGEADIAIGADHGGYALKERIGFKLKQAGFTVHDCGTHTPEAVDYPDYAHAVARLVAEQTCSAGIIVDGAGIGSAMVANKVPGVRAALCYDVSSARNSREHNHANVLTLGAGLIGDALAWQITETWLDTPWGEGRHARRVDKITDIDRRYRSEQ
ncbi:MAG: ribose 5-phosphate isomerase B [Acidimicrobiia bacterium]|nr:ribose 5-phosphate isomerase B [Acidimicrobiia bacterium]